MITMLMSVELILNSVNINFVAFNKYLYPDKLDGIFFTCLLSPLPLRKRRWPLRSFINLYRNFHSIDVEAADEMKF
jgi:NADH:ubiquinone oxidoreductase subunit K